MKDYRTIELDMTIPLPESTRLAMQDIAGTMLEGLLAMPVSARLGVTTALMEESVTAVCGPKGKHLPDRAAVRHGSEAGSVTFGAGGSRSAARESGPQTAPASCPSLPMSCSPPPTCSERWRWSGCSRSCPAAVTRPAWSRSGPR